MNSESIELALPFKKLFLYNKIFKWKMRNIFVKEIENLSIKYGLKKIEFQIPKQNLLAILEPKKIRGVIDEQECSDSSQRYYTTHPK